MEISLKILKPTQLSIEINHVNYLVETKFRQRSCHYDFDVVNIEVLRKKDTFIGKIQWKNPLVGKIDQTITLESYKSTHNDVANTIAGEFSFEFISNDNTEGIIDQTYGFIPELEPYFMIPGNIYHDNNIKNSKSIQPQLNYRGDISYPKSPVIYTRADRSTHNAVIAMADKNVLAVRINECTNEHCEIKSSHNKELEYLYNGLGIDTKHTDPYDRIAVTMGYHHFPVHYYGKLAPEFRHSKEDELHTISFAKDVLYETTGHLFFAKTHSLYAYEEVIAYFYNRIHQRPGNKVDRVEAVTEMLKALTEDAYYYDYHYFPTVLSGEQTDTSSAGDVAWTGGMQVVYPMIRALKYVKDAIKVPFDFIDALLETGFNESATMLYESKNLEKWSVSGWWKYNLHIYDEHYNRITEAHSAYVNGQATCYLLKSYDYLTKNKDLLQGKNIESWLEVSKRIIDHVIKNQRYDGALGVYFNPKDGKPVYYNSFQGTWFLAGIAELFKLTKEIRYRDAFYKANEFYEKSLEKIQLWGMPMDTEDAVDEEGNLAYITALTTMHKETNDKDLLELLKHAFHYEFSWKFAYNTVHVNEPLKSLNWASSGGSITSSHNIHIHQMGNLVCEEMYYLYLKTHDSYILSRLKDTLNWGLGTHNSEYYDFGFGKRGWATEQFFHTDGKQDNPARLMDGGIWYDYLSWAAACCLLSASADIPDELYES